MKKMNYEAPVSELILLSEDLIRTSLLNGGENPGDEIGWDDM